MSKSIVYQSGSTFPALTPSQLRIYCVRWCPYVQRVLLILEHKQITYERVYINLVEKPEWYLEINPKGTVPTLQQDDKILFESLVLADYLDETYPGDTLTQTDPFCKARDRMFVASFTSKVLDPYYTIFYANETNSVTTEALLSGCQCLEEQLKSRDSKYLGGDKPMMVDFILWPHIDRVDAMSETFPSVTLTSERFPLAADYIVRMKELPAVQQVTLPVRKFVPQLMAACKGGKVPENVYDVPMD